MGSPLLPTAFPLQVYLFAEAMAEGAVKMGMPMGLASKIAAQTLMVSLWGHPYGAVMGM